MAELPNARAQTEDFEFAALQEARNYRQALFQEFGSALKGDVVEVGAGIGQMTEQLARLPGVNRIVAIEPDPEFCKQHRQRLPGCELLQGTILDLPVGSSWDGILSINVLEHISDDRAELQHYSRFLQARHGALCLFVPARPEIYGPIDKDFGHFRRYTRPDLKAKLGQAGFMLERLHYFNSLGYFAWWLNFRLLKKREFEPAKVRFYDRILFPIVHTLESTLVRPPFGQSLLAIARASA